MPRRVAAANGTQHCAVTDGDRRLGSSSTEVTLAGSTPWLQYKLTGPTVPAQMYTPTSSDAAGDPTSWVVKGSNDGTSWTTLDTRTDETFAWQRQTRAFTIAHPGIYCY